NAEPSSPPATPGSRPRYPPGLSHHTSSSYKRMGFYNPTQSPPLDNSSPLEHPVHRFRDGPADSSSRPSSASGRAESPTPRESTPEVDSQSDDSSGEPPARITVVAHGDFTLEEVSGSETGYDSDTEIVRPDQFEDADSDEGISGRRERDSAFLNGFEKLNCEADSDEEEQLRRYRSRKKRWSAGLFKRSHSQSVGSDSDIDDSEELGAHDVGSSARRLRRRVRGPGDRSSLIFDELAQHIVEVEEPEEETHGLEPVVPPDIDAHSLAAMPFWVLSDPMEIDSDA
ncbi:hypothetical protein K402DRAFT_302879, partial [Aulographum hederae CBS 113979]